MITEQLKHNWKYIVWTLLILLLAGVLNQVEIPEEWLAKEEAPAYRFIGSKLVPTSVPEGSEGNTNCMECHK